MPPPHKYRYPLLPFHEVDNTEPRKVCSRFHKTIVYFGDLSFIGALVLSSVTSVLGGLASVTFAAYGIVCVPTL